MLVSQINTHKESIRTLEDNNQKLINENLRPDSLRAMATLWLSLRLEVLSALISLSVAIPSFLFPEYIPPEWAALALTYSFRFPATLMVYVDLGAQLESKMVLCLRSFLPPPPSHFDFPSGCVFSSFNLINRSQFNAPFVFLGLGRARAPLRKNDPERRAQNSRAS